MIRYGVAPCSILVASNWVSGYDGLQNIVPNLPCTLTKYSLSSSPAGLEARHVYLPVSSTYKIQVSELHSITTLVLAMRINIHYFKFNLKVSHTAIFH